MVPFGRRRGTGGGNGGTGKGKEGTGGWDDAGLMAGEARRGVLLLNEEGESRACEGISAVNVKAPDGLLSSFSA